LTGSRAEEEPRGDGNCVPPAGQVSSLKEDQRVNPDTEGPGEVCGSMSCSKAGQL